VVYAAEENGEDADFGGRIINFKVKNKILVGYGANAWANFGLFRVRFRLRDECPHVGKGVLDSHGRALNSNLKILAEFLVGVDEMILDKVKVA